MVLFQRDKPRHSLLLMPVKRDGEVLPRSKLRVLACDADGKLFTQLIARSAYQRLREEAGQMETRHKKYATVHLDTADGTPAPLLVEIENQETWALERILEHALRNAVMPDVLRKYPREIIRRGNLKHQETATTRTPASPRVLERLPYYRKQDIEVSIPIYKARSEFPLIVLKKMPPEKGTPADQQRLLVLDSGGDIAVTVLPMIRVRPAEKKLNSLREKGKEGYLVCRQAPTGITVEVMEVSRLQAQALGAVARHFQKNGREKPLSAAVKKVLNQTRETVPH